MNIRNLEKGYFLVQTLVFASIAVFVMSSIISFANTSLNAGRIGIVREKAFQIAEAGVEYYRWHLAHAPTDYTDGTGGAGPYVHNFYDKDGVLAGTFSLEITPPPLGSTLVKIESTGVSVEDPNISRTIVAELAIPSFAKFAVVTASHMRFGEGTEIFGPVHSNGGIRMDGIAHNVVTSALSEYDDPDHSGGNEFGVHTHVNIPPSTGINNSFRPLEAPPNTVPARPDVFVAGRNMPVPAVDFAGITLDLSTMRSDAQANGAYFASSGAQGYRIVFRTNDTFDIYRVTSLLSAPYSCNNLAGQSGWGTWSTNNVVLLGNFTMPANGIIFVEDHVWVEGQVDGSRVTVASARFPDNPSTRTSITVNNDLLYTNYDGSDVISLIAQNNINAGMASADTLRIDAALVAQNGRVGRYYYENDCSPYDDRSSITLYGMIASALRYGFAYTDDSGYAIRNIIYDAHLLYGPPPSFPLTTDEYQIISWKEVVN